MGVFLSAGCRIFQAAFHLGGMCLPWRTAKALEGPDGVEQIPALLRQEGAACPMVVATPGRWAAVGERLCQSLEGAGMSWSVYSHVGPDPTVSEVEAIVARCRSEGCDSFVAVGGGSPIDAAKAAAARLARPDRSVVQLSGLLRVRRRILPLVAVPTTAGSGSETTIAAVITDESACRKAAMMDLCLIPRYAVLDPTLTLDLPPDITAQTGMDALTHAVEAYLCWAYNTRQSLGWAEQAVALIFANLERVWADGSDLEGRRNMLRAAYLAGAAFTRAGVGNVHAIAHALGGRYHIPHGLANAVVLPVVLEDYGAPAWPKLARLARAAGIKTGGDTEDQARALIRAVRELGLRMGIPRELHCIEEPDIPQLAARACAEANPLYPVPVIYTAARFCSVIARLRASD